MPDWYQSKALETLNWDMNIPPLSHLVVDSRMSNQKSEVKIQAPKQVNKLEILIWKKKWDFYRKQLICTITTKFKYLPHMKHQNRISSCCYINMSGIKRMPLVLPGIFEKLIYRIKPQTCLYLYGVAIN